MCVLFLLLFLFAIFFFSSRRRHTIYIGDWSSDVCSSDLTAGQLTSNSQGVFGLNGLNLNAAGSNATQGSVITSAGKNVHLDSGTRMLLVSQTNAGEQGGSKPPAASKPETKPESKPGANKPNKQ